MAGQPTNVTDNSDESRFEITEDGRTAVLKYRRRDGNLYLVHTEVPPALEGRGIGSRLAKHALEQARAEGLKVVPWCPFVRGYIEKHPEYEPLVTAG